MTTGPLSRELACLARDFYAQDTNDVAKSLLGAILARRLKLPNSSISLAGYIIETEAYGYRDDPASHAFGGLRHRNSAMFGKVGCLYVYFIYGKHFCLNVTARKNDTKAGAVLIRSILPLSEYNMINESRSHLKSMIKGPGRVAKAMSITLNHNGLDVTRVDSEVSIHRGRKDLDFITSKRIGISKAVDRPWRYIATRYASDLVT